jgi:hypothetical protein
MLEITPISRGYPQDPTLSEKNGSKNVVFSASFGNSFENIFLFKPKNILFSKPTKPFTP